MISFILNICALSALSWVSWMMFRELSVRSARSGSLAGSWKGMVPDAFDGDAWGFYRQMGERHESMIAIKALLELFVQSVSEDAHKVLAESWKSASLQIEASRPVVLAYLQQASMKYESLKNNVFNSVFEMAERFQSFSDAMKTEIFKAFLEESQLFGFDPNAMHQIVLKDEEVYIEETSLLVKEATVSSEELDESISPVGATEDIVSEEIEIPIVRVDVELEAELLAVLDETEDVVRSIEVEVLDRIEEVEEEGEIEIENPVGETTEKERRSLSEEAWITSRLVESPADMEDESRSEEVAEDENKGSMETLVEAGDVSIVEEIEVTSRFLEIVGTEKVLKVVDVRESEESDRPLPSEDTNIILEAGGAELKNAADTTQTSQSTPTKSPRRSRKLLGVVLSRVLSLGKKSRSGTSQRLLLTGPANLTR